MRDPAPLLGALVLALAGGLGACASADSAPPPGERDPYYGSDLRSELRAREVPANRVLLPEQLTDFPDHSLRDVISRFRPQWLRPRMSFVGSMYIYPGVWLDNTRHDDIRILERIRVWQVEWVRYLDPEEATNRYGGDFPAGAIVIETRSR